nr:MAG TPA: hypothetical protein [Caudoviricetes sp.]
MEIASSSVIPVRVRMIQKRSSAIVESSVHMSHLQG